MIPHTLTIYPIEILIRGKRNKRAMKTRQHPGAAESFPAAPEPLFVLVSVLSKLLLAFMRRNLPQFAFSSAGHFNVSLGFQPSGLLTST
jgi:hypothetical protein